MRQYLYHYFERDQGPFKNLSSLPEDESASVLEKLRQRGNVFASNRSIDYLIIRKELESKARKMFIAKGGKPRNNFPHYMILGECKWVQEWYSHGCEIRIELDQFDPNSVSFTYGDLFPTMRYKDGKPYRGIIYLRSEIFNLIEEFGFPQQWNKDGLNGPERYIEAQVWDDEVINKYIL